MNKLLSRIILEKVLKIFAIFILLFLLQSLSTQAALGQGIQLGQGVDAQDPDIILLKDVWEKAINSVKAPAGMPYPPQLYVMSDAEQELTRKDPKVPNAFATLAIDRGKIYPVVVVNLALLKKIIEGTPDRLAYVLGHELGHHILGHVKRGRPTGTTLFMINTFTREQELEADKVGLMAALASGYGFREALGAMRKFIDLGLEYSPLEAVSVSHPSWSQRLEKMDKDRAGLWQSVSAFRSGVVFLAVEQFASAERCFDAVVKQFPDCYEAWANLGYARLMQYCDLLSSDDIKAFDVGHLVIAGFYERPRSLEEKGRGKDAELWRKAVDALDQALKLHPTLTLAKANLGIAYLVKPEGKDAATASRYLEEAVTDSANDKEIDLLRRIVILTNAGVANLANGKLELSAKRAIEAYDLGGNKSTVTAPAILYNFSATLVREGGVEQKRKATQILYDYLRVASRSSVWFPIGTERYQHLCSEQALDCKAAEAIVAQPNRMIFNLDLGKGRAVSLADTMAEVEKRLGKAVAIPVVRTANIRRLKYPQFGVEVLGREQVLAIALAAKTSPAIQVRRRGLGSQAKLLRVGMPQAELAQIIGTSFIETRVFNPLTPYRFYPDIGLAVRLTGGTVAEIMIVQIPRTD